MLSAFCIWAAPGAFQLAPCLTQLLRSSWPWAPQQGGREGCLSFLIPRTELGSTEYCGAWNKHSVFIWPEILYCFQCLPTTLLADLRLPIHGWFYNQCHLHNCWTVVYTLSKNKLVGTMCLQISALLHFIRIKKQNISWLPTMCLVPFQMLEMAGR